MPRILFHGDPHGNLNTLRSDIERDRPDAVILLGDQMLDRPLEEEMRGIETPVFWIHGNHDTDTESYYSNLFDSPYPSLDGRVLPIQGVTVAGLGGVFQKRVWHPNSVPRHWSREALIRSCGKGNLWRGGLPRGARDAIYPADYDHLSAQTTHVLVLHEAPDTDPLGHKELSDLARAMNARLVIHGHLHKSYRTWLDGQIEVIGLGERESLVISLPRDNAPG